MSPEDHARRLLDTGLWASVYPLASAIKQCQNAAVVEELEVILGIIDEEEALPVCRDMGPSAARRIRSRIMERIGARAP
jgi:hypothetical protein